MTRKEQIDEEAFRVAEHKDEFRYSVQFQYFVRGAEWADKTMIDKICKLLKDSEFSDDDGVISKFNEDYIENVIRKYLEE